MKMPAKQNPLAWLATCLMAVALWGCKQDREELLSTIGDSPRASVASEDESMLPNAQAEVLFDPAWDDLIL